MRYCLEAFLLAGLCAAVFVPGGCSHGPVNPQAVPTHNTFALPNGTVAHPGSVLPGDQPVQDAAQTAPIRTADSLAVEKGSWQDSIGVLGGAITMEVEGELSFFTVPASALEEKTEMSVTVYRDESAVDKRITEFHFEPEGLLFKNVALLSYRTCLKDGDTLALSWWDGDAQKWMLVAEAIVVNGYATFPVLHFSDYRTTERISLGGQRGGR